MDSYNEILERMEKTYENSTGTIPDKYSDTGIRLRMLAGELFNVETELEWFKKQMFPNTATGIYLDYHAEERGLSRKSAIKAAGTVMFAAEYSITQERVIPKGTVVATDGEIPLRFITTEDGVIEANIAYVSIPVTAEQGGSEYNVAPQDISVLVTPVAGIVQVINLEKISGGADTESDDELRQRLLYTYKNNNNGTNIAYYKELAESVEGVYSAGVIPRNRGAGTVDVFISKENEIADSNLIQQVQSILTQKREVNVNVLVRAASSSLVSVYVAIGLNDGYEFEDVKQQCVNALTEYINSLGVGGSLYLSRAGEKLYHIPGVKYYNFDYDYCFDVIFNQSRFPVAGDITVVKA